MIKYKTSGGWNRELIVPIEVVRETEHFVILKRTDRSGKEREDRTAKISEYAQIHNSWTDARDHLLAKAEIAIRGAQERLEDASMLRDKILSLKEPKSDEAPLG